MLENTNPDLLKNNLQARAQLVWIHLLLLFAANKYTAASFTSSEGYKMAMWCLW